ncbi:MAG TPA: redoxin domain-containing protein [Gemmatimonadaceae bacterium]|nr:redoxin domain-containing protein [Gemmatimonadaceae bacterium]
MTLTTPTMQRPPRAGERAPDFTLPSTSGESVSLDSFRGRAPVLIAFFPLAFTSVCTAELCDMGTEWDEFVATGVRVLPISVDAVPSLREFKAKHRMPFDLLSDFKREASRAYGVLDEERFLSRRAYFLVDRDGTLRWTHVEEHGGMKRDNSELLERIAELG